MKATHEPYPINIKDINSETEFFNEAELIHKRAEDFLLGFKWCKQLKNSWLYTNLGEVFCIFLFEIKNTQSIEDNFIWIIIGDIPTMYLDIHGARSTKQVIEDYINLAEDWITNVETGRSVNDCYPFNAAPTAELAELLKKKITFMKNGLLDNIEDIRLNI